VFDLLTLSRRQLCVVETPGFLKNSSFFDRPKWRMLVLQQEIFISLLKTLAISLRGLHFKRTGSTRLKSF
jgi:hypothetical protein